MPCIYARTREVIRLCAPADWTRRMVEDFANSLNRLGETTQWVVTQIAPQACDGSADRLHWTLRPQ